ncbi:TIGR03086 family protein [Spiractinospora alimapuensis]|uniref:TIGR03086 family metal-binding protein n=1 Tax=Spiractinospora alimapuensis TaxID=2820884 RepID=UPI001F38B25A|nr:TIGR03086 family metal-binding protein [Spiractinospora alimapuensis]QVQ53913.1 TIGR03086 family protein [Spiractinospora alimapuensis]
MTDLLDMHGTAMAEFDRRMHEIGPTQWADRTPCTEWDVHDLVDHLVTEQLWVPYLLDGGRIEDAGDRFDGNPLGDEPVRTWEVAAREARRAWLRPGATEETVHLSFGDAEGSLYLWQMTFDLAVHAWDLAKGIGADPTLNSELVAFLLDSEDLRGDIAPGQSDGLNPMFAPQPRVADDADGQTLLLAKTGRSA